MMAGRANYANPRQFLDRPANDKTLEASQFGDLEEAVLHRASVVEEDLDLAVAFETGDGIDFDAAAHRWWLLSKTEAGKPKR